MYSKKDLRYEFSLSNGTFDKDGNDKISISNVKSSFRFGSYGNYTGVNVDIMIFGLSIDRLSELSGKGIGIFDNPQSTRVSVYVGNDKLFSGFIVSSYANMNGQPETAIIINAVAAFDLKVTASSPFSRPGAVSVSSMLDAICRLNGYEFHPNGLDGLTAQNPHFPGSPMDQIRDICLTYDLAYQAFDNTITVWPAKSSVSSVVPFISPDHGLIGYPVFTQGGITFQTQFSTLLSQGRDVELQTSLPNASGRYRLTVVEHFLSSWTEGGNWHTVCQSVRISQGENK
ncbi:hypothetical protein [Yersinia bercovieri]|uniref:hypothetical protein n=1 Tax=Yersinia bercovieri TaxID=634 RepID=UPI0005E2588F|nr:hypothetical protein [Yersinia bercovieri]CNI61661.1 Uncharacterised protein [Yersinia bercovieri]